MYNIQDLKSRAHNIKYNIIYIRIYPIIAAKFKVGTNI